MAVTPSAAAAAIPMVRLVVISNSFQCRFMDQRAARV
jgi:hypothetical protein